MGFPAQRAPPTSWSELNWISGVPGKTTSPRLRKRQSQQTKTLGVVPIDGMKFHSSAGNQSQRFCISPQCFLSRGNFLIDASSCTCPEKQAAEPFYLRISKTDSPTLNFCAFRLKHCVFHKVTWISGHGPFAVLQNCAFRLKHCAFHVVQNWLSTTYLACKHSK